MEKSVCGICDYSLQLSKHGKTSRQDNAELVAQVLDDETSVHHFLPVDVQSLQASEPFKALNRTNRTKLLKAIPQSNLVYYQTCKNPDCGQTRLLAPGLVYREERTKNEDIESNYSRFQDSQVLPRTAKYKCPNKSCKTHAKPELRNAVFFRATNSLQIVYLCIECKHYWKQV